jgi:serine/threonine-protein kinase
MPVQPGQMLSHYRLIERIGEGGMGEVYRAHDERLERDVALKVLRPGAVANESSRKRFRKEALVLSQLNHPNIATVYDFDTQDDVDFLVMEYVRGKTLHERLAGGPLTEKETLDFGRQLTEGLSAAHAEGILHRDLKPGNLRITHDDRLKILDFGLAKVLKAPSETAPTETQTRGVVGTLAYMAPEQMRGATVDERSDLYAAGAVLYEMASGERPFPEEDTAHLVYAVLNKPPEPLQKHNPTISHDLQNVVLQAMAKQPAERYSSALDLRADLERVQQGLAPAAEAPRRRRWPRSARLAAVAAVLVTVAVAVWIWQQWGPGTGSAQIASLAVLPLENLSGDPEQEYFSDGMTEALITNLSKIGSLKVISRTSTMRYKGPDRPPLPDIARELGVDAVVEGSVLRVGDRVRITAQLIEAATDQHLWADSFERDMRDILSLQSEVSRAITDQIRLELTAQEEERLATDRRVDPEAYKAYLMGEYYRKRFWPAPEARRCIEFYQQAIEKEPNWADAYAGLAGCYVSLSWLIPPKDVFPRAKAAAEKALELDPNQGAAYVALADINIDFEWDWAAAEQNYSRALELSPNNAYIHSSYAFYLAYIGRFEDAIREKKIALELNPVSAMSHRSLGYIYLLSRRYEDYEAKARTTLEMAPENIAARFDLAWAYALQGMREEALAALEKGVPPWGQAWVLATLGEHERALQLAEQVKQDREADYLDPLFLAQIYAALGEADEALRWLEDGYESRSPGMPQLKVHPGLDPMRDDPRFQDLLRRMNFPE